MHSEENCNQKPYLELVIDYFSCEIMSKNTKEVIMGNNFRTLHCFLRLFLIVKNQTIQTIFADFAGTKIIHRKGRKVITIYVK